MQSYFCFRVTFFSSAFCLMFRQTASAIIDILRIINRPILFTPDKDCTVHQVHFQQNFPIGYLDRYPADPQQFLLLMCIFQHEAVIMKNEYLIGDNVFLVLLRQVPHSRNATLGYISQWLLLEALIVTFLFLYWILYI